MAEVVARPRLEPLEELLQPAELLIDPGYLQASLVLTRPDSVIVIDNVVRDGAVTDPGSLDARVKGVRAVLADIAQNPMLEATALQTVGSKGWDGFTLIRRSHLPRSPSALAASSTSWPE